MSNQYLTLVLGGARCGKSRHAETLTLATGLEPWYFATGTAGDGEMAARIEAHKARRNASWNVVEEPLELAAKLDDIARYDRAVMVDCLTLWLTNQMMAERDLAVEMDRLLAVLEQRRGPVFLVSNEVGQGIVPVDPMARAFVDAAGILHQRIAALARRVDLVTAGLPFTLKPRL